MKKNAFLSFLWMISCLAIYAQDAVISVGPVQTTRVSHSVITLTTSNAFVQLQVYSPSIIRTRISRQPFKDDFSYAVVGVPVGLDIKVIQTATDIRFSTDSIKVIVQKNPFAIHFYTLDDQLISQDEPGLPTSWIGSEVTTYKTLQEGERFLGLGEKTGNLDRRGNAYTNWNSDVYGYAVLHDPLYSSIPFYIGVHHGLQYGIFLDNSYQTDFNFGASNNRFSSFAAKGGEMNYYFIYQSSVAGIIRSYTQLTGRMALPPLWSLGYQQNRYSYFPDTEVYRIAKTLREKRIPADGITLDIHYMDQYKLFTWNKERFPEPRKMIGSLDSMGFKTTLIVDPGIKIEAGYPAYESGLKENIFVGYPDGKKYSGEVWPGWCHFPDFSSTKGRNWWKSQITNYTGIGVAGIWNDMNEIATWGQKMPSNVLFDYDGHPTTHLQAHNIYGLQMARASYEAAKQSLRKRPFILTRAGFAGMQRYTALWTGDNRSEDDHMLLGVRLLSSLGLSGVAFTGMDIGGFIGTPTPQLYARWMQLGAFTPYFRNHSALNTKSAEPWSFGEEVLDIARNCINLRYRLLPYLYAGFYEASQTGMPLVRSLAIDYTQDATIYHPVFQHEYLFGPSFLVVPQESVQRFAKVYFPKGTWYDFYSDTKMKGRTEQLVELSNDKIPVYVKSGSIIPMQSLVQHTGQLPGDTLLLHVYYGEDMQSFNYYEDDGESYAYEKGDYYLRTIRFDPAGKKIVLEKPKGQRASHFKWIQLVLHGFDSTTIAINGISKKATNAHMRMMESVPAIPVKNWWLENTPENITLVFE